MRGLTLWQPMAWAVAENHKPVENRSWPLPDQFVGERFAVHAGKKYDDPWAEMIRSEFGLDVPKCGEIALGAVVAVATFASCIDHAGCDSLTDDVLRELGMTVRVERVRDWYSGPYGFLLRDVQKLAEPIPCRGFQGLWTLPPPIEKAVVDQLGAMEAAIPSDQASARFHEITAARGQFTPRDLIALAAELRTSPEALCRRLEQLGLLAPRTFDDLVGPSGVLAANGPHPARPRQQELFTDPENDVP